MCGFGNVYVNGCLLLVVSCGVMFRALLCQYDTLKERMGFGFWGWSLHLNLKRMLLSQRHVDEKELGAHPNNHQPTTRNKKETSFEISSFVHQCFSKHTIYCSLPTILSIRTCSSGRRCSYRRDHLQKLCQRHGRMHIQHGGIRSSGELHRQ